MFIRNLWKTWETWETWGGSLRRSNKMAVSPDFDFMPFHQFQNQAQSRDGPVLIRGYACCP